MSTLNYQEYTILQSQLISSLKVITANATKKGKLARELKLIQTALKKVIIPESDYQNVLRFIFLFLRTYPEVMQHHDSQLLKSLCYYCIEGLRSKNKKALY